MRLAVWLTNVCLWHDLAVQTGANERQVATFPVNNLHNCEEVLKAPEWPAWAQSCR
jgi:hypothetical protein